jgi:hypothetical protein
MAAPQQVTIEAQKNKNALFSRLAASDGAFVLGNPGLAIDTNFDIQAANAFDIVSGGKLYTISAGADFDTGTAKDITIDYWAAALLSIDIDGTPYLQWATEGSTEAAAIAQLDGITPTGDVVIGYVTVQTKSGFNWVAGTDALQGGTGGDVSADTNYYAVWGWLK